MATRLSQLGFFRGAALRGGKSIKRVFIRLAYTPPHLVVQQWSLHIGEVIENQ